MNEWRDHVKSHDMSSCRYVRKEERRRASKIIVPQNIYDHFNFDCG